MKTLLIVTYVDFWRKGSGHRTRINSIINYFREKARITVFFAGSAEEAKDFYLNELYPEVNFEFASILGSINFKQCKQEFENFIKDKYFDFALIEYIELSIVLEYLPEATITLLDTHDLIHDRISSFEKYQLKYDGIILDKQEEMQIFKCFNYIILIQKTDYDYISKEINSFRLILAPHPVALKKKLPAKKITNVGYVASQYQPNVEALNWFINNVWDKANKEFHFVLNIYGNINNAFSIKRPDIIFHGLIDDLDEIYNNIDIAINPVRCGAGLKIKNVEALGYGVPLITTSHGASGIEDGSTRAFLLADTVEEYLSAFEHLSNNYVAREQLSNNAFEYAFNNFTEKKCFQGILNVLNNLES